MFWGFIALGVSAVGLILFIVWINRRPKPPPQPKLYTGYERRGAREVRRDPDEEAGPSPELLARMDAAGMNTTHERWDDFARSKRLGTHRPLASGERAVSRREPDDRPIIEEDLE